MHPCVVVGVIGLLTGVLNALLGIGGGVVVVPALVFFAGFSQKEAQAASLWYVIPTCLFASVLYRQTAEFSIRLEFVAAMVAAAFVGALIGVPVVKRIDQKWLKRVFGVSVICIALIMIWRSWAGNILPIHDDPNAQYLVLTWIGLTAGFLSSLLGIGGGVVVVPLLVLIGAFEQKVAQGMSLMYIVPTALFSAMLYWFHAKIAIDVSRVALMIATGFIGCYGGWLLMTRTPSATLRMVFAVALILVGVAIIVRARHGRAKEAPPDWVI